MTPYFTGTIETRWCADGRKMILLDECSYVDEHDFKWPGPKDWVVDGSSIPWWAWSAIGAGPFEGRHRFASIFHDVACDKKEQPWRKAHRMFHSACIAAGEDPIRAKIMYMAILIGGPKWKEGDKPVVNRPTQCKDIDIGKGLVPPRALQHRSLTLPGPKEMKLNVPFETFDLPFDPQSLGIDTSSDTGQELFATLKNQVSTAMTLDELDALVEAAKK